MTFLRALATAHHVVSTVRDLLAAIAVLQAAHAALPRLLALAEQADNQPTPDTAGDPDGPDHDHYRVCSDALFHLLADAAHRARNGDDPEDAARAVLHDIELRHIEQGGDGEVAVGAEDGAA